MHRTKPNLMKGEPYPFNDSISTVLFLLLCLQEMHTCPLRTETKSVSMTRSNSRNLVVSKAKDWYEAELEELNQLMKKRDELRNKELPQAIEQSRRSFEEIIDFLGTDDYQN